LQHKRYLTKPVLSMSKHETVVKNTWAEATERRATVSCDGLVKPAF